MGGREVVSGAQAARRGAALGCSTPADPLRCKPACSCGGWRVASLRPRRRTLCGCRRGARGRKPAGAPRCCGQKRCRGHATGSAAHQEAAPGAGKRSSGVSSDRQQRGRGNSGARRRSILSNITLLQGDSDSDGPLKSCIIVHRYAARGRRTLTGVTSRQSAPPGGAETPPPRRPLATPACPDAVVERRSHTRSSRTQSHQSSGA